MPEDARPAPPPERVRTLLRRLEAGGVALLLAAALVPRARDLTGPFDREMEGFQGSCFAVFAVNYERLGAGRFGGYPVFAIDLPRALAADGAADGAEPEAYVYPNHPPTVPLLGWAALAAAGPEGWEEAWREDLPPEGIEPVLRLPFLAFHVLGLAAFWWALRQGVGPREAMLGLAVLAVTPVSVLYATLVNYENPSLALVALGYGFHARYARSGARRDLALLGGSFLAAGAVTFAPALFVPPLVLQLLVRRAPRRAVAVALVAGGCALVPLVAHGLWVRAALPEVAAESVWSRAHHLVEPLLAGSAPLSEWTARQARRLAHFSTPWLLAAAGAGLAVAALRAVRPGAAGAGPPGERVQLGPPLALGGLLVLLAFYRHTWDGAGVYDGQTLFLLNLAPGVAALAATGFDAVARPLARLRGGIAPLVVLVSLFAMPAIARANEVRARWRAPGPRDAGPEAPGPAVPLPSTAGEEIRALVPPGTVALYPESLGLTPAVSYYAWRTLLPVAPESYNVTLGQIDVLRLSDRPRVLLLPLTGPPVVLARSAELREIAARGGEPAAQSEAWEVWPVPPR